LGCSVAGAAAIAGFAKCTIACGVSVVGLERAVAEVPGLVAGLAVAAAVRIAADTVYAKSGETLVAAVTIIAEILFRYAGIGRVAPVAGEAVGVVATGVVAVIARPIAGVGGA
jgi:hypothetical protein